ncbi:hypothetical protein C8R46DRAFT_1235782 [Mycena filopes]|nr:hypothetical protein C8R46DRAFT_1235782 [Mycena filopes]
MPMTPGRNTPGGVLEGMTLGVISDFNEKTPVSSGAFHGPRESTPGPARSNSSSVDARGYSSSKSKVKKSKMTLKPIPPTPYDGSPDPAVYMQFVHEARQYLQMGRVSVDDKVMMISYQLTGKAEKFYRNKVSRNNPSEWTLEQFFAGLFKYCFPLDFCMQQRERLDKCLQNDKLVSEHVLEFEELYLMIGLPNDQERIIKLFLSFNAEVQKEMYRQGIDPETSSWDEVIKSAEHGEFILNQKAESSDEVSENSDSPSRSAEDAESSSDSDSEDNSGVESTQNSENEDEEDSPEEDNGYWSPSQLSNSKRPVLTESPLSNPPPFIGGEDPTIVDPPFWDTPSPTRTMMSVGTMPTTWERAA